MLKFSDLKKESIAYHKANPKNSISQSARDISEANNLEYVDTSRRKLSKWLGKVDNNFDNETVTETSQYLSKSFIPSAWDKDLNRFLTVEEFCDKYGLKKDNIKSSKLISHNLGHMTYNIAFGLQDDIEELQTFNFLEELITKVENHAPNYKSFNRTENNDCDKNLFVIDCADIHIAKFASAYETGEDYNIDIAIERVKEGFFSILKKAENFNIDKILLVIGNDILHFDNSKSTTTSGTFQDTTGTMPSAFNSALDLYVGMVDSLIDKYDVDIIHNPSNHDYLSGWMLSRTLEAWYRQTDNVTCYTDMRHRKYYQYGDNMLCTSHGDGCKMQDLPMLMATEAPIMWASTKYRYAYLHHIHHKQVTKFQSGKDYIGVTVEYLRSPSASDRWHSDNGYVGAKKAVEGFIHSYKYGQVARITHYFS